MDLKGFGLLQNQKLNWGSVGKKILILKFMELAIVNDNLAEDRAAGVHEASPCKGPTIRTIKSRNTE